VDETADGREELTRRILADGRRLRRLAAPQRQISPLFDVSLTMQQLKVLIAVAYGASSSHQLTEILGVGMATVTGLVDRLSAQGMVTRREDPADRRIRRVELTAEGRGLLDRLNTAGELATRRLLEQLDEPDLRVVEHATRLLCEAAERAARHDAPGSDQKP
jgi:DNA-binding MarR family transcriptional regulator